MHLFAFPYDKQGTYFSSREGVHDMDIKLIEHDFF